jgi:sulfite reductase (NADPH) flavoprotein alpha-component
MFSYFHEFEALEKSYLERDKKGEALSFEETLTKFHEQRPNVRIYTITEDNKKNLIGKREVPLEIRAILKDEDLDDPALFVGKLHNAAYYFVSRYDGEILPLISRKFFVAVEWLHKAFTITRNDPYGIGSHIVGLTTIVITLLSLMGLYFYIPMLKRNFSRNIKLDFKSKGYAFWYKLHSVLGVYTSIFVLIMCLTGLYWSYGWFNSIVHKLIGFEWPQYEQPIEQEQKEERPNNITEIIKAYNIVKDYAPNHYLHIGIPSRTDESYGISYIGDKYSGEFTYNPQTNETSFKDDDKDKEQNIPLNEKFIYSIYDLHTGAFFGEIGRALWCVSSLCMALFGISGATMFYKRTKRNRAAGAVKATIASVEGYAAIAGVEGVTSSEEV